MYPNLFVHIPLDENIEHYSTSIPLQLDFGNQVHNDG